MGCQNAKKTEGQYKVEDMQETKDINKTLVVYFSQSGTTKTLAKYAADETAGDLYEIVAKNPYTEEDLAYYTSGRADLEQEDIHVRPDITGTIDDMEAYDTIILGYPIWHGQAPRIILTFLESYDFSNKTILPFCTSHSSGIGSSDEYLHAFTSDTTVWLKGERFSQSTTQSDFTSWLKQTLQDKHSS